MFSYLRYFSAISTVLIIAISLMIGYYFRNTATNDLKIFVEKSNISLTQSYINTIWRKHAPLFKKLENIDRRLWVKDEEFIEFSRSSFQFFEGVPLGKLNIYTTDLRKFLTTDPSEIKLNKENSSIGKLFQDKIDLKEVLGIAQNGEIRSNIIYNSEIKLPDGTIKNGALVQTVIPIIAEEYVPVIAGATKQGNVQAIIEIFYDISSQQEQLQMFQLIGTGGILIVFIALISALYFTSKKAEIMISKKHDENLELESAKARAEAESRDKSQFMANISHELRTPLNAIIGFSEIIKNETYGQLGNAQYLDYAKDIHTSGEHLLSLINDILDFSKAEAGKLELDNQQVDATKLLKASVRMVSSRADSTGVKLIESYPEDRIIMTTDPKRLKQIVLNLLSNSVKFTPSGGEVRLSASFGLDNKSIMLVVKDTGIGMAKKDVAKAMAVFGQVDSELSRRFEGTGLGLPLTRKLTALMGGTFEISSEPGCGTEVTITLPIEAAVKAA